MAGGSTSCAKVPTNFNQAFVRAIYPCVTNLDFRCVSPVYLQYSPDCSTCIQRGQSSKPCLGLSKLKRKKNASIQQLWYCRGPKSLMLQGNLFLLRDDREAEHLLISAICEHLGSPAGEAIHGSRRECSINADNGKKMGAVIDT